MSKIFIRIAVFLLVPGLIMDPAWGYSLSQARTALHYREHDDCRQSYFEREAVLLPQGLAGHREMLFVSKPMAMIRHIIFGAFSKKATAFMQEPNILEIAAPNVLTGRGFEERVLRRLHVLKSKRFPSGSMRWVLGLVNWVREVRGLRRLTEGEYRRTRAVSLENTSVLMPALFPAYISLVRSGQWEVALGHFALWAGALFIEGHLVDVLWAYVSPFTWAAWWGIADGRGPEAEEALRSAMDDTLAATVIILPSWLFLGLFHIHFWSIALSVALFYLMHWAVNRASISPIPAAVQKKILELEGQGIRFLTARPVHKEAAIALYREAFPEGDMERFEEDLFSALFHKPWDYPRSYLLLAEDGHEIVGMGLRRIYPGSRDAHLSTLAVTENRRRRGIGIALIGQRILRILEEWPDVRRITLNAIPGSRTNDFMRDYFGLSPQNSVDVLLGESNRYEIKIPARGFSDVRWFGPALLFGIALGLLLSLRNLDIIPSFHDLWRIIIRSFFGVTSVAIVPIRIKFSVRHAA